MKNPTLIFLFLLVSNLMFGQTSEIVEVINGHQGGLLFLCGSKSCDGYNVDTFLTGSKRIEGKFSHGKAVGIITSYFQNGNVSDYRYFANGKLNKVETFDSTGKLIKELNWKKKNSITYEYGSQGLVSKTVFDWKHVGWQNGKTTLYKWENNKWVKK
jgi:antitoxin component YwqK of YwqJK toxin-antitoxin module